MRIIFKRNLGSSQVDGTAAGFMSLSTDVNIDVLDKCFELEPFNGLKKYPKKAKPNKEGIPMCLDLMILLLCFVNIVRVFITLLPVRGVSKV